MTDEQLKRLAKLVAYEIIREIEIKQLDEIFTQNNMVQDDPYELLIAEIARLMTLMAVYEEREQYEKAAIVKNKIDRLQKQIERL